MLEALSKPELDVFILDRGLFDALVWTHWLAQTGKITSEEEQACYQFFAMSRWTDLVDLVLLMTCDPATSIAREYSNQLTTKRGTIMSEETLRQINRSIDATKQEHGPRFKAIEHIDTTGAESRETAVKITEKTLDVLTNFVDETICVVPAEVVSRIPSKGLVEDAATIEAFVAAVDGNKRFVRRSQAEVDPNVIQPIPCAIIRWKDQILLLRRNKKGHALHEKYLLWAGGHVNVSDDSSAILLTALERELSEEVFIRGAYKVSDRPIALLRTDEDARASRHIGVLYEITLTSDDVALALHQKEFKETRGTSMSGRLVDPGVVLPEIYDKLNDWSKSMVQHFWPELKVGPSYPLFEP